MAPSPTQNATALPGEDLGILSSPAQRRLALGAALALVAASLFMVPWSENVLPPMMGLLPVSTTFGCMADLLTAGILLSPFAGNRRGPLALLGATYLYSSFAAVAFLLTFPNVFSTQGLFGAGSQTATWLYQAWRFGVALGILAYLVVDAVAPESGRESLRCLRGQRVVLVPLLIVLVLLFLALCFQGNLPTLIVPGGYSTLNKAIILPAGLLAYALVLAAVVRQTRCRSLLHLGVAMSLLATEFSLFLGDVGRARYTLGWYAARADALIASLVVVTILFVMIRKLYATLIASEQQFKRLEAAEREARLRAEQALRDRESFLAVAAHELKTPLTNLRGFAYTLRTAMDRDGAVQSDRARLALRAIDDQSEKADRLIRQMFDLTVIEERGLKLELAQADVSSLVNEVVSAVQLRTAIHTLRVVTSGAIPAVVDALRLEQVLVNLLDNAIRFSPEGGPIVVEVGSPALDTVCISVRDRGIGVPGEKRAHLFERLAPAHASEYRSGLGLGLYISRRIVEMHGGTIAACFPAEGGSLFIVTLPRVASS